MYARDPSIEPIRTDRRHDATREMVGVVAAARAPDGLLCEIMCVRSNEASERERPNASDAVLTVMMSRF